MAKIAFSPRFGVQFRLQEPRLSVTALKLWDLVKLDDADNGVDATLFKTIEALRGAFFFSTIVPQLSKCLKFEAVLGGY